MSNMEGISNNPERDSGGPSYLMSADPGNSGGGTYSGNSQQPTLEQYESIFGPAGRDVKVDSQRHKRHQRWHLPDALKGPNTFLTDRIDGLITDATNSPFTRNILPYKYVENPDQKFKWNVYSFDEGMASRVPYEAAARVLPQSKRSFAGYIVRQGLAIAMEHNFMLSAKGRENFKHQLTQLVGSIQLTNDLDVHVALLQAPSYQRHMSEKYYDQTKTVAQLARQYTDIFGIMQKHPNALDILIEDAKNHLRTWGAANPSFLMTNGKLTAQMTMNPEKTNYLTNGPDGAARLAQGPDLPSYRGLSIIHSRKFSLDTGTAPRDLLRRKVRVAQYHYIKHADLPTGGSIELYDQSRDSMFRLTKAQLYEMGRCSAAGVNPAPAAAGGTTSSSFYKNSFKLTLARHPAFPSDFDQYLYTWPDQDTDFTDDTRALVLLYRIFSIALDAWPNIGSIMTHMSAAISVLIGQFQSKFGAKSDSIQFWEPTLPSSTVADDWIPCIFKAFANLYLVVILASREYVKEIDNGSIDYGTFPEEKTLRDAILDGTDRDTLLRKLDAEQNRCENFVGTTDLSNIDVNTMDELLKNIAEIKSFTDAIQLNNLYTARDFSDGSLTPEENNQQRLAFALISGLYINPEWYLIDASSPSGVGVSAGTNYDIMILRPNIEHEMLSIIMGRGGDQELGCTFWGQTELSCYDDAQHGIWGMSYKYHERAMVLNEKNLIRVYDVAFDGYNGGMDQTYLDWDHGLEDFRNGTNDRMQPYTGPSMIVMLLPVDPTHTTTQPVPNPLQIFDGEAAPQSGLPDDPGVGNNLSDHNPFGLQGSAGNPTNAQKVFSDVTRHQYKSYLQELALDAANFGSSEETPGEMCIAGKASGMPMAFEGSMKIYDDKGVCRQHVQGSGHLGPSYVGVASIREGRGVTYPAAAPTLHHLI